MKMSTTTAVKGVGVILAFLGYVNNMFGPLVFGLLILVALDILFHFHKGPTVQMQKLVSGFMSILGVSGMQLLNANHGEILSASFLHYAVAVLFASYLSVVGPEVIQWTGKLKWLAKGTKSALTAAEQAELTALRAQAQKQQQTYGTVTVENQMNTPSNGGQ